MREEKIAELSRRIRDELDELQRTLKRTSAGWESARRTNDDLYLDGVALNLHGVYSGLERLFAQISETIDDNLPQGENWHTNLLQQMANEASGIRPAVISAETSKVLNELRKFRHVVRNVYTHHFDPERLGELVKETLETFPQIEEELLAFNVFLEQKQ